MFFRIRLPNDLKRAEVILIFKKDRKKDSKNLKENYKPVSIQSNISKIYETCLYNKLSSYFEDIFSVYQFGFRKERYWCSAMLDHSY